MREVKLLYGPFDGADTNVAPGMFEIAVKMPHPTSLYAAVYTPHKQIKDRWVHSGYVKKTDLKREWALKPERK